MDDIDECITYKALEDALHYIYFGEVTVKTLNDVIALKNIGEILEVAGLEVDHDIEAVRPTEGNQTVFDLYTTPKQNTRSIQSIVVKPNRQQILKMIQRRAVKDSDSEGSFYDPDNSDHDGMVLHRHNPIATGAKQKKAQNTHMKKVVQKKGISTFTKTKPAQMVSKPQAVVKKTRIPNAVRRVKPTNVCTKSNSIAKSVKDVIEGMNISLTQEELDRYTPLYYNCDESLDQEESAIGYSPKYEPNDVLDEVATTALKPNHIDRNNNKRDLGSQAIDGAKLVDYDEDFSHHCEFNDQQNYEYDYKDGTVGDDMTEFYGENVYVEDLSIDQHKDTQSNKEEWSNNNAYHAQTAEDDQARAIEVKSVKSELKKGYGWRKGVGKNASRLDDQGS